MKEASIDGVDVVIASAEKLASYEKAAKEISQFEPMRLHDIRADPHSRLFVALFDGTGNDVVKDPEHASNVGLLKEQIENNERKDPTIGGFYKEGPGTQGGVRGIIDGAIGGTYQERIDAMYEKLKERTIEWLEEDPEADIKVVSVGFSRGAEQAAGFSRLLHERGIQSPEDQKELLRAPGTTPQALCLYDPVATGIPSYNDRRPPPSVVSGMQITAGDEYRNQFPSTTIIAQGKSEDGRFLGVITAGAHSDIGGGYLLNGLPARNFNLMADYLNKTIGNNFIAKVQVPPEPEKSVIHDSTQHKWFYRAVEEREIINKAEPTGRLSAEPVDAAIMLKFSGKSIPEITLVHRPLKPEGHEVLLVANGKRLLEKVVEGAWSSRSTGPSRNLPEGSYDLTGAERPAKSSSSKSFEGSILHTDKKHVYQLQDSERGKANIVRHDMAIFKDRPEIGTTTKIDYVRGAGQVVVREQTVDKSR
jgi:hypothetical protein